MGNIIDMQRILVTRKSTGLGSDLISIVGAHAYASRTNRDLIIDWRKSLHLDDKTVNMFSLLFDVLDAIEGVPIRLYAEDTNDDQFPRPILYSNNWPFDEYHRAMITAEDRNEPTLVVKRPMHHLPTDSEQRRILDCLTPIARLKSTIERFRNDHFADRFVVGVHIRHGNTGEKIGHGRQRFIRAGTRAILKRCTDLLQANDID